MRVKYLANVAERKAGDIDNVPAERGEKLIRTGYAVAVSDEPKKAKAA
jgi:hypothetical protein